MPTADFMRGHRSVMAGGHVYTIGPPTVTTVATLMRLFPLELKSVAKVFSAHGMSTLRVNLVIPIFTKRHDDACEVLQTCVTSTAPPKEWPLDGLAAMVLRDVDLDRIVESFTSAANEADPNVVPDAGLDAVWFINIARFLMVDPMTLARWPYEAYLTARDAVDRIQRGDIEQKRFRQLNPTPIDGVTVM